MKKFLSILLTLTIAFFTLPFSGNMVLADGKNIDDIEDGDYGITAKAMHEDKDEASGAAGFINEEAVLSIKDGKAQLTITVPKTDGAEITGLQVEGQEPVVNEGQDAKDMTYELTNLKSELNAQVQYEVPSIGLDHDVPFRFILEGLDDLPVKEEEATEPEDDDTDGVEEDNDKGNNDSEEGTEPEEEPEQDSDDSVIKLDKGYYTIDTSYLRDDNDDKSSMASYLESPVFLEVKDGKVLATITISEDETVTKMQVEGKNAVNKVVDGKKRHETFELDQLDSIINAYVEYQAPFQGDVFKGNAEFRISFDKDSVEKSKKSLKPGIDAEQDADKDSDKNKDGDKSDEKDNGKQESDQNKDNKGTKQEKKSDQLVPDKAYEINYTIMHEDGNKPSISDEFFKKPAKLFEKDGKTYLQMTIMNGDMISELSNKYGNAVIVEKNDDGSIVVQLRVNDNLSDMLLDMHVKVPAGAIPGFPGYDEDHAAILVFDKDSMKEIDVGNSKLVASDNENGPTVKGTGNGDQLGSKGDENDKTPKKPEFGSNDDNGSNGSNGNKAQNPKTGDTSGILLYTLLLLGSALPLVAKLRRRFI
ncbi:NEAT domain-containing protein [Virgibacillus sp. MSJ-26]|uniref:NEAT domain-containing protein n=1 Tax=Virgibacillus sp. MSJ-26 TaxID=2841522 RepID=UPI001C0FFE6A|nr:NEAT domain-containing protein [Virgibacillus sp. MSJ-26]MBU5467578.1 NEAT domain-containing protein [Virgibacillus sp. MSJ-26]